MHYQRGLPICRDSIYTLLQECLKKKDLILARNVHSIMIITGMDTVSVLSEFLIHIYASTKILDEADAVFKNIPVPTSHTWHAIISAHVKFGSRNNALTLYQKMQEQGTPPNKFIFLCILKACCTLDGHWKGLGVHSQIIKFGLDSDVILGTTVLDMYAKCGKLQEAANVFSMYPYEDSVLWGALISGYVQHGQDVHALGLFRKMQDKGITPDVFTYSCILKAYGNVKCINEGREIHDCVIIYGHDCDKVIGSTLVDMYIKFGNQIDASKVFESVSDRDNVLWSTMIAGYVQLGDGVSALNLFERMQREGKNQDIMIYCSVIKACAIVHDAMLGRLLQEMVINAGIDKYEAICNAFIDMYSKCGTLKEAEDIFAKMPEKSVMSWNTMISTYIEHQQSDRAIEIFKEMEQHSVCKDDVSVINALKACSAGAKLEEGRLVHDSICKILIELDAMVQNTLIDMYAKCGDLEAAYFLFSTAKHKDNVTWNAIIAGCGQHGNYYAALAHFFEMQDYSITADQAAYSSVLRACGSAKMVMCGFLVNSHIIEYGMESDVIVGSALVDMYCKCALLEDAERVFLKLSNRNVVSWNSMITGYIQQGEGIRALEWFAKMDEQDIQSDVVTLLNVLKACASAGAAMEGKMIHHRIITNGHDSNDVVCNTMVDMYGKCSCLKEAKFVFDSLKHKDAVSWNAMIAGYARLVTDQSALELFKRMQEQGIQADHVTYLSVIKACINEHVIEDGKRFHSQIVKLGFEQDSMVLSVLLDMYASCGLLGEAQQMLDRLPSLDIVTCNEMLAGYVDHGHASPALTLFKKMQEGGIKPDKISFSNICRAFQFSASLDDARRIHKQMTDCGIEMDEVLGSSLIDMYVKCGALSEARQVFDHWPKRDIVFWSAMIGGYVSHDVNVSALELFSSMLQEGLEPDEVIFLSILKACGNIGAIKQGMIVHDLVIRKGFENISMIKDTLIDVYGKVGNIHEAGKLFNESSEPTLESWTAMLSGYTQQGECQIFQEFMNNMQKQGWKPDERAHTSILTACSHAAKVDEGQLYFQSILKESGIVPAIQHLHCTVDLLGRAGHLEEAVKLVNTMPTSMALAGWTSLLNACRMYGNYELGKFCFSQLAAIDPSRAAGYDMMSNMHKELQMQNGTFELEELEKHPALKGMERK